MKKILLLTGLVMLVVFSSAWAQQKQVTGKVTDTQGNPVPAATIIVAGTTNGSTADADGHFVITAGTGDSLEITSIGFTRQTVKVPAGNQALNIVLKENANVLNETVVTALGISKQRRSLGFSVTELKGEEVAKTNEVNPVNALQGRVAGVQIDQGAGGLFGNSKILIRGNSTLGNNNQPIFVVDGVIMDNGIFGGTGRDFGNDLKDLNMDNFASVSILKGSAAAALYGSRAINGVVLITTKKGYARKGIGVTVINSTTIIQPYSGPEFQNEFGGGSVGGFFTDNRDPNYQADPWTTKVFPVDPVSGKPYIDRQMGRELENWGPRMSGQEVVNYDGTMTKFLPQPDNYLDAYQVGKGNNTNVAIDGGNENSTFRLSFNHNSAEGVMRRNTMNKNSFDLRVTRNFFNDRINVDASVAYTDFNGKNPPRLGGYDAFGSFNIGHMYTWELPRNFDTKYWMQKDKYTSILGGVPNPSNPDEPNKVPEARFWFQVNNDNFIQNEQLLRGRVAITAKINDWAKLVLDGNFNNIYSRYETTELGQGIDFSGGSYAIGLQAKQSNTFKAMLMVDKKVSSDFSINGYIGAESQHYKIHYDSSATAGGLNYPGGFFLSNSVNPQVTRGGILTRYNYNSLYASADIAYKDVLYLNATWRGDWASALTYTDGSGNNFYNYPALSLSWIFNETFKLPSWVSFGKLRASIAALGGSTDPFILNPGFAFNGYTTANGGNVPISTYSSSTVLQPNIKPQRKISKEIGMDARFLGGRAGFDLSFYQDNTRDQILDITTPVASGVNSILINAGNIQNKGIELSIDATPVKTKSFSWTTTLNYSRNRNLIVSLYPGRTEYNLGADIAEISTWAVVGKSYGTLRTTIHSKAFQAVDANGKEIADPRNGLPILTWRSDARAAFPARSNEWQDVGNINANFRGGWDNTFNYKNFSLDVLLDTKIGGDFVLASYRFGTHTGALKNTLFGRDAEHGGITWTSKYPYKDNDGTVRYITYDDGMIPDGVFATGQMITQPDGSEVDVSGMTFKEAYEKGYVEPTHAPQFYYRYGSSSTGVADYWIKKDSWVSLRQVSLTYSFPKRIYEKIKLTGLSVSAVGRDLLYLYNSLPLNFNPASNNSNNTAFSGENGFLPMTRSMTFTLQASF